MYTVETLLTAIKGKEEDVENELRQIVPLARTEKGNFIFIAHRSHEDPCVFLTYERYGNEESFNSHKSSPHMQSFFSTIYPMLDKPPQNTIYESLD
ncbi:MAG: antibiotic biosynthesis monooxygenase [Chloroflexi bacterium]|nr:antibiotic biosynthesis monooxygenase [Chloroflexota bacterium]